MQTLAACPPPSCPEGRGLDFCQGPPLQKMRPPAPPKTTSSPRFAALSLIASMRPGLPRAPPRWAPGGDAQEKIKRGWGLRWGPPPSAGGGIGATGIHRGERKR